MVKCKKCGREVENRPLDKRNHILECQFQAISNYTTDEVITEMFCSIDMPIVVEVPKTIDSTPEITEQILVDVGTGPIVLEEPIVPSVIVKEKKKPGAKKKV